MNTPVEKFQNEQLRKATDSAAMLMNQLNAEGLPLATIASAFLSMGMRCLNGAGCSRRKAKEIAEKTIAIIKWRNPF